jgi:KDO2-lipid IV(A) lauroyltransferase
MKLSHSLIKLVDTVFGVLGEISYFFYRIMGWRRISSTGRFWGRMIYRLNEKRRQALAQEIRLILTDEKNREVIMQVTRRCFENHYARITETFFFGRLSKDILDEMIEVRGMENIDKALSCGHGVILLLAHFGSFLLPLPYLGYNGYKVNQLTGKQRHKSLIHERVWVWRKRDADRLPVKYIQAERFLRPMLNALKNNEILCIAFDGRDGSNWTPVNFLGRKATFSVGPFKLARKTGAVIIPTFVIRNQDDTHRLFFEKSFDLPQTTLFDLKKTVADDTDRYTQFFSEYVKKYPCHFGMTLLTHNFNASEDYPQLFVDET